jgi:hypothetical protein
MSVYIKTYIYIHLYMQTQRGQKTFTYIFSNIYCRDTDIDKESDKNRGFKKSRGA